MKSITVTIGIAAYQSEHNISQLLISLLKQKQKSINIEKIIVYADGCTDKTVDNAKSVKSKKIQVINSRKNRGFAFSLQSLISKSESQVFVGLNDDIKIEKNDVIQKLIEPFKNSKVGLVGGNVVALKPQTFIGRCIYTSYLVFEPLRYSFKKGQTDLTCDGKIFALSYNFAKTLNLKKGNVGNVDIFLYYENLKQGRLYRFAKKAEVKYRLPEDIDDFKNQESRAQVSRRLMKKQFGYLFEEGRKFPKNEYMKSVIKVIVKYPLETVIFKLLINNSLHLSKKYRTRWKLALSTKKLSVLFSDFEWLRNSI